MEQLQEKSYETTIKVGICQIYDPIRGEIPDVKTTPNMLFSLKIESIQTYFKVDVNVLTWFLAFPIYPFEFQWFKDYSLGTHGDRPSLNYASI